MLLSRVNLNERFSSAACYKRASLDDHGLTATVSLDVLSPAADHIMTQLMDDDEGTLPTVGRDVPDPHGQTAMLLVESLIHGLIARSIIPVEEAIDIVTVAIDVQLDVSTDRGDHDDAANRPLAMLRAIRRSLSRDVR